MKKILGVLITLVLLVTVVTAALTVNSTAASGYVAWDGNASSSYAGGNGSASNPYLISTPAQLLHFSQEIRKGTHSTSTFALANDIYFNDTSNWESWSTTVKPKYTWVTAGTLTHPFSGVFDGRGFTIYGLYVNSLEEGQGFIGATHFSETRNLKLKESFIYGATAVGGIVGRIGASMRIVNCENYATVVGCRVGAGGIVGGTAAAYSNPNIANEDQNPPFRVQNCRNYGKIICDGRGDGYGGGIVGFANSGRVRAVIENCENYGEVTATGYSVGGIMGGCMGIFEAGHNTILNCTNYGTVSASKTAGGIVGKSNEIDAIGCRNYGDVTATTEAAGGISGGASGASELDHNRVRRCVNFGNVTSANFAGGLVGYGWNYRLTESVNHGTVTGTTNAGTLAGRMVGDKETLALTIDNCLNLQRCALPVVGMTGTAVALNKIGVVDVNVNGANYAGLDAKIWSLDEEHPVLKTVPYDDQIEEGKTYRLTLQDAVIRDESGKALGVRFATSTDALFASENALAYGTLILPTSMLDGDLWRSTEGVLDVPARGLNHDQTFNAVLTAIPTEAYETSLTVRSYMEIKTANGNAIVYSKPVTVNCRDAANHTEGDADAVVAIRNHAAITVADTSVTVGASVKANATAEAAFTTRLSYKTGDAAIATVDEHGNITGVSEGETTLTVTANVGGVTTEKTVKVEVYVPYDGAVVSVNQFAKKDNVLHMSTNPIPDLPSTISKNDGVLFNYNDTVLIIDSGDSNTVMLNRLLALREQFLRDGGYGAKEIASTSYKLDIQFVLSHYHGDHYNAFYTYIVKSPFIRVTNAYLPGQTANNSGTRNSIINRLKSYHPSVDILSIEINSFHTLTIADGKIKLDFLAAMHDWSTTQYTPTTIENSNSVWCGLTCNGRRFLFTGDTYSEKGEFADSRRDAVADMIFKFQNYEGVDYLDADFFKPMHHGRKSDNKDIIQYVTPEIVFPCVDYAEDSAVITKEAVKYADIYHLGLGMLAIDVYEDGTYEVVSGTPTYRQSEDGAMITDYFD